MLNDLYHALDPIAFSIGPVNVYWYGLAYIVGAILTGIVMYRTSRRWGLSISVDDLSSVVISVVFGLLIGARLFYVVFYGRGLEFYLENPLEIIAVNHGGMSFHGGFVGGVVGGVICCRALKLSPMTVADLAVVGAPLALALGRCANFVNGELWGKPTDLPWGVVFETGGAVARHPSQLYEALLEGVVLFVVLYAMSRRNPPHFQGTYLGTFAVGYGIARFCVEFVRMPDAQLGYLAGGWLTMGQVLSLPVIAAGIAVIVWSMRRRRPQTDYMGK